jgi:peptide/nickel transport system permease protein
MTRYLVRRLLGAVPMVLGIATIMFFVVNLAPGDPTQQMIAPGMRGEVIEQIRENWGLDRPIYERYVVWLGNLVRGDLGPSYSYSRPVSAVIADALPNTLILSGAALVVAFVVGVLMGVVQAVRQHSVVDVTLSVVALFFYSMPSFWLAIMLILVFAYLARNVWHWPIYFPVSGPRSVDYDLLSPWGKLKDLAYHAVLPVTSLSLVMAAGIARYTRGSVLEVVHQDFVRTARAKGLPERTVIARHVLRNALTPVITLLGLYLPVLFSGTVFIESIFAWPGMGKTVFDAISQRDYPVIMAATVIFATMVVVANLLADLLYALVDPRIRYE